MCTGKSEPIHSIIKKIRKCQSIAQKDVANQVGVTQSAISQYEEGGRGLSVEAMIRAAPLLNLNPEFVRRGEGVPFLQADPSRVIKILTTNNTTCWYFVEKIISSCDGEGCSLVFLDYYCHRHSRQCHYVLLIEDSACNRYVFRRKNYNKCLDVELCENHRRHNYTVKKHDITDRLFEVMRNWKYINNKELDELFAPNNKEAVDNVLRYLAKASFLTGAELEQIRHADQNNIGLWLDDIKAFTRSSLCRFRQISYQI